VPRTLPTSTIAFHIEEAGQGPLVLLCHGFPETALSWRHQVKALSENGFHAAAPDMPGYGATEAPPQVEDYDMVHLVGYMVSLVAALGERQAIIVGHDWGAAVAWHCALLRPDIFTRVAALSVPFQPRDPARKPIATFKEIMRAKALGDFYMVRFQEEGPPEAEFERDVAFTLGCMMYGGSAAATKANHWQQFVPKGAPLLTGASPPETLPEWLPQHEFDHAVGAFQKSGFRGGLNYYRNIDRNWELMAAFDGLKIRQPALFITGERDGVRKFAGAAEARLAETVPGLLEAVVVPDAGHWVQQEEAEVVSRLLVQFCKG
jgi:pimeloyl-ACP methyl ester carboxylesterase